MDRLAGDWRTHSPTTKGRFRRIDASMSLRSWALLSPVHLADVAFSNDWTMEATAPALEVRTIAGVEIAYNRSDLEQLRQQGAEILRFAGAKSSDHLVLVWESDTKSTTEPNSAIGATSHKDASNNPEEYENNASSITKTNPGPNDPDPVKPSSANNTTDLNRSTADNTTAMQASGTNTAGQDFDVRIREQFVGGARMLGLTVGDSARSAHATILVGAAKPVLGTLAAAQPAALHTVVIVGDLPSETRALLTDLLGAEGVIHAWAPDVVQSLWANCRGGDALHVTSADFVEVVDPESQIRRPDGVSGRLLWSGVGWKGSSLVRIDTGAYGGVLRGVCPACGRRGDRLYRAESTEVARFPKVLDRTEGLAHWYGEVRHGVRHNELHLWLAVDNTHSMLSIEAQLRSQLGEITVHESTVEDVSRRRDEARGESWRDARSRELRGVT